MQRLAASIKSIRKVRDLAHDYPELLGPKFGHLVYQTNVPVIAVAEVLGVTEASVYRWFFGQCDISEENREHVKKLAKCLVSAVKSGQLPTYGSLEARTKILKTITSKVVA